MKVLVTIIATMLLAGCVGFQREVVKDERKIAEDFVDVVGDVAIDSVDGMVDIASDLKKQLIKVRDKATKGVEEIDAIGAPKSASAPTQ